MRTNSNRNCSQNKNSQRKKKYKWGEIFLDIFVSWLLLITFD